MSKSAQSVQNTKLDIHTYFFHIYKNVNSVGALAYSDIEVRWREADSRNNNWLRQTKAPTEAQYGAH